MDLQSFVIARGTRHSQIMYNIVKWRQISSVYNGTVLQKVILLLHIYSQYYNEYIYIVYTLFHGLSLRRKRKTREIL